MKLSLKSKALTLSEAFITMLIIGLIAIIVIPFLLVKNPLKKGNDTMIIKNAEAIEQALIHIIANDSVYDGFKRIKDKHGYFSIEDADAKDRMPELFKKYIQYIDFSVDLDNEYFSTELKDVTKKKFNTTLKDSFFGFFWNQNGALIGFRFYNDCIGVETLANPPNQRGVLPFDNICGSVFFDFNGYKKPNIIGNDQFVLPFNKKGIKYMNE